MNCPQLQHLHPGQIASITSHHLQTRLQTWRDSMPSSLRPSLPLAHVRVINLPIRLKLLLPSVQH